MGTIKVAVDAGHGFPTGGKRSPAYPETVTNSFGGKTITVNKGETFREHVANSGVADYLADYLEFLGFDVLRVGFDDDDGTDDLSDDAITTRQNLIKNYGCDYSLSCHFNANTGAWGKANGIETLYAFKEDQILDSIPLAQAIIKHIQPVFNQTNRGAKKPDKNVGMCNAKNMNCKAAVLMEYAFMDNWDESSKYFVNPSAWYKYAMATVAGFIEYITGGPYDCIITRTDDVRKIKWLQICLNSFLSASKSITKLLVIDGIWGVKTRDVLFEFFRYKEWSYVNASGFYAGVNTVKALARFVVC